MNAGANPIPLPTAPVSACVHRWCIPSPPAPPLGCCRGCGAERLFSNAPPASPWERRQVALWESLAEQAVAAAGG